MGINQLTGTLPFWHNGGERLITREALRDLHGRFDDATSEAPEDELLERFAVKIAAAADRYPGVIITSDHLTM